jgi:hypothetical protein
MSSSFQNIKPSASSDKHGNGKLIGNAFDRATDPTVSAMPTFVRIGDVRPILLHLKDIAGTILYAVSTQTTFIHIDYRRHDFLPFLNPEVVKSLLGMLPNLYQAALSYVLWATCGII